MLRNVVGRRGLISKISKSLKCSQTNLKQGSRDSNTFLKHFCTTTELATTNDALRPTGSPRKGDRANKRVAFPNHRVILKHNRSKLEIEQNKIALKVSPTMSKWEIREILQRAYGLPVKKVNTVNFDGNVKRWQGRHLYRTKKWKKAIVELEPRFEGDTFGWPFETDVDSSEVTEEVAEAP